MHVLCQSFLIYKTINALPRERKIILAFGSEKVRRKPVYCITTAGKSLFMTIKSMLYCHEGRSTEICPKCASLVWSQSGAPYWSFKKRFDEWKLPRWSEGCRTRPVNGLCKPRCHTWDGNCRTPEMVTMRGTSVSSFLQTTTVLEFLKMLHLFTVYITPELVRRNAKEGGYYTTETWGCELS